MSEYDGAKRPLSWDLLHPLVANRTTEDDGEDCSPSSFVWPEDSDERVLVLFELSLNEYVVLSSTIDVGSDIAYGIDALRVQWLWQRNMRCQVSLCAAMIEVLQTCPEFQDELIGFISNAVQNPSQLQEALRNFISGDEFMNQWASNQAAKNILPTDARNQNILKDGVCDSGYLYNQAMTIVSVLDTVSRNVLFSVASGADPLEYAKAFLLIAPVVGGWFNAAAILATSNALATAIYAVYGTDYDAIETDLFCDVWCLLERDCTISIDRLIVFYINKTGLQIPYDPLEAFQVVLGFIADGGLSSPNTVYLMHLLCLTAMRLNQVLLGIDFASYAVTITVAGDTSDDGYLGCTVCPTEHCYPLTEEDDGDGFNLENEAYAVWVEDEGFTNGGFGNISIGKVSTPWPVKQIKLTFDSIPSYAAIGVWTDEFVTSVPGTTTLVDNVAYITLDSTIAEDVNGLYISVIAVSGVLFLQDLCTSDGVYW